MKSELRSTDSSAEHLIAQDLLPRLNDTELIRLRAALEGEMRKRKIALTIGQMGEQLAISFFNRTAGCPNLMPAPPGTANVDALSRRGERYSIKTVCNAKKTGTVYPDAENRDKQLFEYMLVVKMNKDWSLEAIFEFDWQTFQKNRSWDRRMNAWYIGASKKTLDLARKYIDASA